MSTALEPALSAPRDITATESETLGFVTMRVAEQLIGVSVLLVHDVLREMDIAQVPLSQAEIAGLMNLRGRIVTVVDVHKRLGLPKVEDPNVKMHAVVEFKDEFYSLMVDSIGEVVNLPALRIEKPPANLEGNWREVASGVCRMEKELLILLDVQSLLTF